MQRIVVLFIIIISVLYSADHMLLASFKHQKDARNAVKVFDKILRGIKGNHRSQIVQKNGSYQVVLNGEVSAVKEQEIAEAVNAYFGETLIEEMPKEKNHHFFGKAVFGAGYDDNIYHHTDIETTPYADLLIENNTTMLSDTFHREILALQHQYQFDDTVWSWGSMVMAYNKTHTSYDDLDLLQLALYSGPQYAKGKYSLALSVYEKKLWFGGESYMDTYGVISKYRYLLNEEMRLHIQVEVSEKRFIEEDQKDWDSNRIELKNTVELMKNRKRYFIGELGIYGERRVQGGRTDVSYDALYISGKYLFPVWKDGLLSTKVSYETRDYSEKHPNLPERIDDKWKATVELSHKITEDVTAKLNYTYTQSDSSINLYTYDSSVVILNMSTLF
jgi:hypothetical protein